MRILFYNKIQGVIVKMDNKSDVLCAECMSISIGECENMYKEKGWESVIENGNLVEFIEVNI